MKCFSLLLFLFFGLNIFSQNNYLDTYKYVIVDSHFDFVKKQDGYETSSLTKFLFNKIGFESYLDIEVLPEELTINNCKALYADVIDKSGVFSIKSIIQLKDCKGKVIYTSKEGKSKIKNYRKGYHQSIRLAFDSLKEYKLDNDSVTNKNTTSVVAKPTKKLKYIAKKKNEKKVEKKKELYKQLYSKEIKNGFQLLKSNSEIVFILLKTNQKDTFIIKDKNGTLTKKEIFWLAEYYKDGELVTERYKINNF